MAQILVPQIDIYGSYHKLDTLLKLFILSKLL
jgi:hypothetical protein